MAFLELVLYELLKLYNEAYFAHILAARPISLYHTTGKIHLNYLFLLKKDVSDMLFSVVY